MAELPGRTVAGGCTGGTCVLPPAVCATRNFRATTAAAVAITATLARSSRRRNTRSNAGATLAVAATALTTAGAGAAIRGATLSTTRHLPRRTLTLTRRAVIGLSRNAAGGLGEAWSAPRLRRTREARPFPALGCAYTFRLFWSILTEEALTELGAATPTALGCPGQPRDGG
jgi:hypothetical protein